MHHLIITLSMLTAVAVGYILGRWHSDDIAERSAVDEAVGSVGTDAGTKGGGGKPPVKR